MNFYASICNRLGSSSPPIRVHPLLLSLSMVINMSERNPDLHTISESDERVLTQGLYTSPSAFPPLEIHFPGQNGLSLLSNQRDHALTPVAGCRECTASAPQDNSGGESNTAQGRSDTTAHALEDNIAHTGATSLSPSKKGKKRRRASSGAAQGNPSNARGPKAAALMHRAKGKAAQKARSSDANHSSPEEILDNSPEEGRDREVGPCMFTEGSAQRFLDNICHYHR